jgi:hypothetical protein
MHIIFRIFIEQLSASSHRSGFKTFNRVQGQGELKQPTAGISGIFQGLDVSVQHSLSRRSFREDGRLRPRAGFETTSKLLRRRVRYINGNL